jgi:hypothetical protein
MSGAAQARKLKLRETYWSVTQQRRDDAQGDFKNADLTTCLATLEAHYVVLEAELDELNRDIRLLRDYAKRYASDRLWDEPIAQLKKIRAQKEALLKSIKFQMDLFNLHINQGRDLCAKLARVSSTIRPQAAQAFESQTLAIDVVSSILANARSTEEDSQRAAGELE